MFPRRERTPRVAFPELLKGGKRLSSPHFSAIVSDRHHGYAVVVSKKTARLSVSRHRLKRRALAALKTLVLPPSLILFPKPTAATLDYEETKRELAGLLSPKNPHSRRST